MNKKSTVNEIRERFDNDVERFSNLETGQSAAIDSALSMELVTQAAAEVNPHICDALDIGCGAGNYVLKLLELHSNINVDLVDLSKNMLERAHLRVQEKSKGQVTTRQADIRDVTLDKNRYDVIFAAAVLHHLRTDEEWKNVFNNIFNSLKPGGSFWIVDIVLHSNEKINTLMWKRYGQYLIQLKDKTYKDDVFTYIEKEDTPRSLMWQIELLQHVGFQKIDILHKNSNFATFGGIK